LQLQSCLSATKNTVIAKHPLSGAFDAFTSILGDFADYREKEYEFQEEVVRAPSFSRLSIAAAEQVH
jgi:hypothetical protein